MFSKSPIAHYQQASTEGGVSDASPHRLIVLLMEGTLVAVSIARVKLAEGNIPERGRAISKAISLLDEGLRPSLDLEKGGELALQLDALYEYMSRQLFIANLKGSAQILEEVHHLMSEIKQAWDSIDPSLQQPPPSPAMPPTGQMSAG